MKLVIDGKKVRNPVSFDDRTEELLVTVVRSLLTWRCCPQSFVALIFQLSSTFAPAIPVGILWEGGAFPLVKLRIYYVPRSDDLESSSVDAWKTSRFSVPVS